MGENDNDARSDHPLEAARVTHDKARDARVGATWSVFCSARELLSIKGNDKHSRAARARMRLDLAKHVARAEELDAAERKAYEAWAAVMRGRPQA